MNSMDQSSVPLSAATDRQKSSVKHGPWLLVVCIIIMSFILRAPITAVGPIVEQIQASLGLSGAMVGMLTTLSLIAFGVFAPVAPRIAARIGMERTLLAASALLAAAIVIRSFPAVIALFAGTLLLGAAISIANVLLPGLVKQSYPNQVGLMTGIYTVALNLGAAIGSGISVPLIEQLGMSWQGALAVYAGIALLSALAWLLHVRTDGNSEDAGRPKRASASTAAQAANPKNPDRAIAAKLWTSPLAWVISLYLALQSFCFYVNVTWVPQILTEKGVSHAEAGWMLSLMQLVSMLSTFVVPIIAGRQSNQRGMSTILAALFIVGYLGLLLGGKSLILPIMIVLGLGVGGAFALALMLFALRTSSAAQAAEMSGMGQAAGYLLAATGPFMVGVLHDWTGGWDIPLVALLIVSALFGLTGWFAGADRKL